ncbi:interferon-induced helicase C domain-containing protein 1-like isoform X2 [Denticeps clupeoides]|uniref:interferon-induced helicase C domain-containing protein 1-like isoform X2 n=1 Tax=Denticeps clupeoides TaxID=299321 RepID=UPI0010A40FE4|nr:interferon-induced helicase C domain-containing protein 1-like isoform X2 [Denticeps clupeoides]
MMNGNRNLCGLLRAYKSPLDATRLYLGRAICPEQFVQFLKTCFIPFKMSADENLISLMDCYRNRLREVIQVEPVLDYLDFIESDQKELILNKARNESNQLAADMLIDAVVRSEPRPAGRVRQFVDALSSAGCTYAARISDPDTLPSPAEEAENDYCVLLVLLMSPKLQEMKTAEVCRHCFEKRILTAEEQENVMAETQNRGNIGGARLLVKRLAKKPPGWFSEFLKVLRTTEHGDLVEELTGVREINDGPGSTHSTHTSLEDAVPHEGEKKCSDGHNAALLVNGVELSVETPVRAEDTDIVLRAYQMDVAKPALNGENIIICLPTGSGKTRIAVYVARDHLDRRRRQSLPGKVVVLVNKVVLVEQHYNEEFNKFLKTQYNVERISGESVLKMAVSDTLKTNDVIVCTAQILENSLLESEISFTDISLLVIDECHHTKKGGVYQQIMARFLEEKLKNIKRTKANIDVKPLPQILGLTASIGVGGATKQDKAQEHILRICANLDAVKIMTAPLEQQLKDNSKRVIMAKRRAKDPFGDLIRCIMRRIHDRANLRPSVDVGTQRYEQWIVEEEKEAAKQGDQRRRVCAKHLRQYSEALHQSNSIRMSDAYNFLLTFYRDELRKKRPTVDDGPAVRQTETEKFLFKQFEDTRGQLEELTKHPEYENSILTELRTSILKEFTRRDEVRGIIFTETRLSAIALHKWIQENRKFEDVTVQSSYLIGAGDQSVVKPMTAKEKNDVLKKFHEGDVNLLIATSVAEEGLDIQKCNVVIRYCLVTNEIAMIQARGRGRAEDSVYIVIGVEGSGVDEREKVNEWREKMMNVAIQVIKEMPRDLYNRKVKEYQLEAWAEKKFHNRRSAEKVKKKVHPSAVKLRCRGCDVIACEGPDIEVISGIHRVNLTDAFKNKFLVTNNSALREKPQQCEAEKVISCQACGHFWGPMMCHRKLDCPCLNVECFVVVVSGKEETFDSWADLAVEFAQFDFYSHATQFVFDDDEENL